MKTCNTREDRGRHNRRPHNRKHRRGQVRMPHFGNIVNEILHAPLAEVFAEGAKTYRRPASNIIEQDATIRIDLAIPGFAKSEVKIAIEKDLLTISANKEANKEAGYKLREFDYSDFRRSFRLSEKIDQDAISAEFKNGILSVTLVKKEEEPAKTITIH